MTNDNITPLVERPTACVDVDGQHGPVISITISGETVSVYLMGESGIYMDRDNRQAGMEVTGPWFKFREAIEALTTPPSAEVADARAFLQRLATNRANPVSSALISAADLLQRLDRERQELKALTDRQVKRTGKLTGQLDLVTRQRDEALYIIESQVWLGEAFANRIRAMQEEGNDRPI